jgi:hypothetical protein
MGDPVIKSLIFDLDDTLVVEEASAEAAFLEAGARAEAGRSGFNQSEPAGKAGIPGPLIFNHERHEQHEIIISCCSCLSWLILCRSDLQ